MGMGTIDSYKEAKKLTEKGLIKVEVDGTKVYLSGSTYAVKDFLKLKLDAWWDKDERRWEIDCKELVGRNAVINTIDDIFGTDMAGAMKGLEG